ncbi:MAG TPA: tetratricopeptide repeat protein [Holophagaceae bacterium]
MRLLQPIRSLVFLSAGLSLMGAASGDITLFQRYQALDARIVEARQAMEARRFRDAQQLLDPCLQKIPDHFEAHFLLAQMAYEHRDYAGALAEVETSERALAALDQQYHDQVAELRAQEAAEAQAIKVSLDELTARGGDPTGCCAHLYATKQSALRYLEEKKGQLYHQDTPFAVPATYRLLHGNCLYRQGRPAEAIAQYRLAIQADPRQPDAWNNLLALLLETGDRSGARVELARAEAARVILRPALKRAVLTGPEAVSPR